MVYMCSTTLVARWSTTIGRKTGGCWSALCRRGTGAPGRDSPASTRGSPSSFSGCSRSSRPTDAAVCCTILSRVYNAQTLLRTHASMLSSIKTPNNYRVVANKFSSSLTIAMTMLVQMHIRAIRLLFF